MSGLDFRTETRRDGANVYQSATIIHDGKEFTAGGGSVQGDRACGYPKKLPDGELVLTRRNTDWKGRKHRADQPPHGNSRKPPGSGKPRKVRG